MKKLKPVVIHIVHNLQIGGVETAVRSSVDYLNNELDFWVITLHPSNEKFIESIQLKSKIKCFNLHSIWAPVNFIRLIWFINVLKPQLIISSLWKSYAVCKIFRLINIKVPIVPIIHNSQFFHFFDQYFTRNVVLKAPVVLCDSNSSKEFISSKFPLINAQVVSFKIDSVADEKFSVNFSHVPNFKAVFIGRLSAVKRIDRVLLLVKKLQQHGVNIKLDVFGPDDNMQSSLLQLSQTLQLDVSFRGAIHPDEVVQVLRNYHFFIQLSDVEGMAITVVQAMQQGLIPIVTQVGEMQYYVKHLENGIVVNPPFDNLTPTVDVVLDLIKLPLKMQQMSEQAKNSFNNQPLYAEHMLKLIRRQIGG